MRWKKFNVGRETSVGQIEFIWKERNQHHQQVHHDNKGEAGHVCNDINVIGTTL
jgi:hypothetical protein